MTQAEEKIRREALEQVSEHRFNYVWSFKTQLYTVCTCGETSTTAKTLPLAENEWKSHIRTLPPKAEPRFYATDNIGFVYERLSKDWVARFSNLSEARAYVEWRNAEKGESKHESDRRHSVRV